MGYEAHITRRKNWSDGAGPAISEQEWLAHVNDDPGLAELVHWNRGNVDAKNPDDALLARMVAAAAALGATVQGDDGETYDQSGNASPPPPPGLLSRVNSWLTNRFSSGAEPIDEGTLPFKVGDRVRDFRGSSGRVTEIDVRAQHGLGRITVRFDDGQVSHFAAAAHGLDRVD